MSCLDRYLALSLLFTLATACGGFGRQETPPGESPVVRLAQASERQQGKVVKDSYIVTFRSHPGASKLRFASFRDEYQHHFSYLADAHMGDPRIKDLRYIATVDLAYPHDPALREALTLPRSLAFAWNKKTLDELPGAITAVDFTSHEEAAAVLKEWEASGTIWFAEPNYVNKLLGAPYTTTIAQNYQSANIWWHNSIKLPQALEKLAAASFTTTQTPVIAVLDSGLDIQHPLLSPHLWVNPSPGASGCNNDVNGCDTTSASRGSLGEGTVYPYMLSAYNTACETLTNQDDQDVCGHGTHVAGIVAADLSSTSTTFTAPALDPTPVGGVCPVCKIMPIKIISTINGSGSAADESIIAAFQYLSLFRSGNSGVVRVANSSFGKYAANRAVELLIAVLGESSSQLLVVAAASNEDSMLRSYPAAYPGTIGVAATGPNDEKAAYSNFGPWVQVAAPGGNDTTGTATNQVASTLPGGETGYKQGTSMASPVVAGVAGLILSYDQNRSVSALRDSIIGTADRRLYDPSVNNGINYSYYDPTVSGTNTRWPLLGSGIVDASAALDGQGASYEGNVYQRVQSGCGSVGAGRWTANWWLLTPLLLVLFL